MGSVASCSLINSSNRPLRRSSLPAQHPSKIFAAQNIREESALNLTKTDGAIITGFSLLCIANIICFFPDVLMPHADTALWRAYNNSHLPWTLLASILWSAFVLRIKPRTILVISIVAYICCTVGTALAIACKTESAALLLGFLCGIGTVPLMTWWFGALTLVDTRKAAVLQGVSALASGAAFTLIRTALPTASAIVVPACFIMSLLMLTRAWHLLTPPKNNAPNAPTMPEVEAKTLAVLHECVSPLIGFAIISVLYGVFCGIAMGDSGSPFGREASSIGAPIGAAAFLVWSHLSKRKPYALTTGIILAAVAIAVPFAPFDISVFLLSFGFQGCGLLLYSLCICESRSTPRIAMCLIGFMHGCVQGLYYFGLYVPGAFNIDSYPQFIGSNPILFLAVYAACAGTLALSAWRDRAQKKELSRMEDQLRMRIKEQNVLARAILQKSEEEYSIACRLISSEFNLTERESQIMSYLARGRDAAYICDTLCLARNTVKGYTKRIYSKLGVHSKQEVIDMVETTMREKRSRDESPEIPNARKSE